MAEEKLVDQRPLGTEANPGTQTLETPAAPEVDAIEERARAQGWVPKDEWDGDPAAWRPAAVFVDRGELLGKIKSQSTEMRELKTMVNYLAEQNRKLYEAGYEKAISELQYARDQAVEAGDSRAVRDLDKQIRDHEKAAAEATKPVQVKQSQHTAQELYQEFLQRNDWYEKDEVMQDWANGAAVKYKTKNPNAADNEVYTHLADEARRKFPEKFKRAGAPNPEGASGRAGGGSPSKKDGNSDFDRLLDNLSEDEAQIARNLVKRGHVTKEEFMESIKLVGGIKR
jgi:hypothetical protein